MIYFYNGVPGSGKSLDTAKEIYIALKRGKNVIANFNVNTDLIKIKDKSKLGKFVYVNNADFLISSIKHDKQKTIYDVRYSYIEGLKGFAENYHKRDKKGHFIEHQTLLVIDECGKIFNPRTWNRKDRLKWCEFFQQHRKYGYDVIMVAQSDNQVDKQIRALFEEDVLHRNIRHYKIIGYFAALLCGGSLFVAIHSIRGMSKKDAHLYSTFFSGRKYYDFYNSMELF